MINPFSRQPKSLLAGLGLILVVVVGFFDYISGPEIGFSIFYLLPISLVTWFVGMLAGFLIAFVSAATWLVLHLVKAGYYSHTFIPYWNSLIQLGFFVVIALLQNALKKEQLSARIDPLTEIGNRRQFFEVAQSEIDRASIIRSYRFGFVLEIISPEIYTSLQPLLLR